MQLSLLIDPVTELVSRTNNLPVFLTEESKKTIHRKSPKKNLLNDVKVYFKTKKELDKYSNKEINNVVGEDIPFHEPENPWITLDNNGEKTPDKIVDKIMIAIKKDKILD